MTNLVSAHEIRDVQTIEFDASPKYLTSNYATTHVEIDKDTTIIDFGSKYDLTTQHMMTGQFNFSNLQPANNGLEKYEAIIHITIYSDILDFYKKEPTELGRKSLKLSSSAMRDKSLNFVYFINELEGISWNPSSDAVAIRSYFLDSNPRDKFNFTVKLAMEFRRSTNQNANFDMFYQIDTYKSPDIPPDNFHHNQIMNTTLLPRSFEIDGSSVIGATKTVYLLLPDELVPRYFKSTTDHQLNLSKIPLSINLQLKLSNSDNKLTRGFTLEYDGIHAIRTDKEDHLEKFKLLIELKDKPLIPITIKAIAFVGQINLTTSLEMRSLWADTGIYAKNEYYFSPNTHLTVIALIGTIFTYKLVVYVEYRLFQNSLAQKNYGLVEEEFMN